MNTKGEETMLISYIGTSNQSLIIYYPNTSIYASQTVPNSNITITSENLTIIGLYKINYTDTNYTYNETFYVIEAAMVERGTDYNKLYINNITNKTSRISIYISDTLFGNITEQINLTNGINLLFTDKPRSANITVEPYGEVTITLWGMDKMMALGIIIMMIGTIVFCFYMFRNGIEWLKTPFFILALLLTTTTIFFTGMLGESFGLSSSLAKVIYVLGGGFGSITFFVIVLIIVKYVKESSLEKRRQSGDLISKD